MTRSTTTAFVEDYPNRDADGIVRVAATAEDDMTPAPLLAALLAAVTLSTAAASVGIPGRAPGLWRTAYNHDGRAGVDKRCIQAGDRENFLKAAAGTTCRRTPAKSSRGYVLVTECPLHGTIMKGRLELRGDFTTLVRGDGVIRFESAHDGSLISTQRFSFTSRRAGDCGANRRVGR